jgi:hypothetical protein
MVVVSDLWECLWNYLATARYRVLSWRGRPDVRGLRLDTETWRHARLIPTLGSRNEKERERRATSCLLAVMHGVPEFGHALLKELGAPKSPAIETFAEVRFKDGGGKTTIPDGAIVCRRGRVTWACLVEVKTGSDRLRDEQVSGYLDIARENNIDAVLTISPQITASSSESPVSVDRRKLRRTGLFHFSWWRVLTEAVVQQRYRGISDPDQEWILRELIHYLSSGASGALGFEDMGEDWVSVRKAGRDGTLRAGNAGAWSVAERWDQFSSALALSLAQELGADVQPQRHRGQTTPERLEESLKALVEQGELSTTLRIPDAIGPMTIRADLRSQQTLTSVSFDAPKEGTQRGRFGWLVRQLKEAPDDLRLEAAFPNARSTTAAILGEMRENPKALEYAQDSKRPPKAFVLTTCQAMGKKRGRAEGSFIRETGTQVISFYSELVQNLKPWQAPAPKVHSAHPTDAVAGDDLPPSRGEDRPQPRETTGNGASPPPQIDDGGSENEPPDLVSPQ